MASSVPTIYNGIRGDAFKQLIIQLLKRGDVSDRIIDILTDDDSMKLYNIAFQHHSVDTENNYEYLEFLGDSIVNTCIVWYISRRFTHLSGSKGVKVLARLKINLISRKNFAECGQRINLWDYITCSDIVRSTCKRKVLEDVFEAFFGATTYLCDSKVYFNSGYCIVYSILANIFDELELSLKYEDLFDARTRIKELFDANKGLGNLQYDTVRDPHTNIFTVKVFLVKPQTDAATPPVRIFLGQGFANSKSDAVQSASQAAINILRTMGHQLRVDF